MQEQEGRRKELKSKSKSFIQFLWEQLRGDGLMVVVVNVVVVGGGGGQQSVRVSASYLYLLGMERLQLCFTKSMI